MWLIDSLAEARIQEAMDRGELDALPGSGRPLELDEQPLVPEELRVAYRVLRNAGYVPPEVGPRAEIRQVEDLLRVARGEADRSLLGRRLNLLLMRLAAGGRDAGSLLREQQYFGLTTRRLDRDREVS
jgi:hypothetical protein